MKLFFKDFLFFFGKFINMNDLILSNKELQGVSYKMQAKSPGRLYAIQKVSRRCVYIILYLII